MATVGVITPVYATKDNQRLSLLQPTLSSVRQQSYPDFVHLIVDDGSTCDVEGFLQTYSDQRIRYIRRERNPSDLQTASNALNFGIDHCLAKSGDVFTRSEANDLTAVAFLHSDDMLTSNSVGLRLANIGNGFVHSDMAVFDNHGKVIRINKWRGSEKDYLLSAAHYSFNHHTVMWDIEFLRYLKDFVADRYGQTGVFDPLLSFGEDRDMSLSSIEASIAGGYRHKHLPLVSVYYRCHKNSISGEQTDPEYLRAQRNRISQKHSVPDTNRSKLVTILNRLTSNLPFSLFTFLPEEVKRELRPIRNCGERFVNERRYGSLTKELETYLCQLGAC